MNVNDGPGPDAGVLGPELSVRVAAVPDQESEQFADLSLFDERMAKGVVRHHLIPVAPPVATAQQVSLCNELGDDSVGGPLGYAHPAGDVAKPDAGVERHM